MRVVFLLVLPFLIFAKQFTFDTDSKISLQTKKSFVSKGIIVDDAEIEKSFNNKKLLADTYLNELKKEDQEKLNYMFIEFLNNLEIQKISEKEKSKITDEVSYSYYLANKESFSIPESIDLNIYEFENEKDARDYNQSTNLPKPKKINLLKGIILNEITPNYILALKGLELNQLSDVYKQNSIFVRVMIFNKHKKQYLTYEQSKANIEEYLFTKKQNEILKEIYEK